MHATKCFSIGGQANGLFSIPIEEVEIQVECCQIQVLVIQWE